MELDAANLPEAPPAETPVLAVESLTKRWPRHPDPVLDAIDLELPPGCVAGVLGANGAGKTTLLRVIAGLIAPDQGRVLIDGAEHPRDRRAYHERLSLLPAASVGLYARLTVAHHLAYWARLAFVPFERRDEAIEESMEAFGLAHLAKQRVDRMSMGQRQRVRLAMTFLPRPRLVLLDEPRNSLDRGGVEMLATAVAATAARGGAVVWSAPTGEEVGIDLDRTYEIAGGRLGELREEGLLQ